MCAVPRKRSICHSTKPGRLQGRLNIGFGRECALNCVPSNASLEFRTRPCIEMHGGIEKITSLQSCATRLGILVEIVRCCEGLERPVPSFQRQIEKHSSTIHDTFHNRRHGQGIFSVFYDGGPNVKSLRVLRVLRPLRTVRRMPRVQVSGDISHCHLFSHPSPTTAVFTSRYL